MMVVDVAFLTSVAGSYFAGPALLNTLPNVILAF